MARIEIQDPGGKNVLAFMAMLTISELSSSVIAASDEGYNVLVGSYPGHVLTFDSYADHPNRLNVELDSTAAGAYQINHPTWSDLKSALALPDFSPVSQDLACAQLLHQCGAYALLAKNQFALAVAKAGARWASLPSSTSGQPNHAIEDLQSWYQKAGGVLS